MLRWPEITGVAEVMNMRGVLDRSEPMQGVVAAGLASGKLVCGHARGLEGVSLQGFAAAGIQSDHEITSGDDLLAKLRAGFTVELPTPGRTTMSCPARCRRWRPPPHLPQTLTICTDDIFPDDLVAVGGIADVLRRLIRYGMRPVDAIRAATLNAAMRLGRRDLGLVAPGRRADLIVLDGLETLGVERVFASGREVAAEGRLTAGPLGRPADAFHDSVKVPPRTAGRLRPPPAGRGRCRGQLRSSGRASLEWRDLAVEVQDGAVVLPDDRILMAVIHRHGRRPAVPQIGILDDWGHWRAARWPPRSLTTATT